MTVQMTANQREWFKVLYFLGALIVFASNLAAFLLLREAEPLLQNQLCKISPACTQAITEIQYRLFVLNKWQWAGFLMFLVGVLAYYWPLLMRVVKREVDV